MIKEKINFFDILLEHNKIQIACKTIHARNSKSESARGKCIFTEIAARRHSRYRDVQRCTGFEFWGREEEDEFAAFNIPGTTLITITNYAGAGAVNICGGTK